MLNTNAAAPHLHSSEDRAAARSYACRLRIACDELYAAPFNAEARAAVLRLIVKDSEEADAAWLRVLADKEAAP